MSFHVNCNVRDAAGKMRWQRLSGRHSGGGGARQRTDQRFGRSSVQRQPWELRSRRNRRCVACLCQQALWLIHASSSICRCQRVPGLLTRLCSAMDRLRVCQCRLSPIPRCLLLVRSHGDVLTDCSTPPPPNSLTTRTDLPTSMEMPPLFPSRSLCRAPLF